MDGIAKIEVWDLPVALKMCWKSYKNNVWIFIVFDRLLGSILVDKIHAKGDENNDRNFNDFYINFGTNFGVILEAKIDLKSDGKSIEFSTDFLYDSLLIFGALWRSPWGQ